MFDKNMENPFMAHLTFILGPVRSPTETAGELVTGADNVSASGFMCHIIYIQLHKSFPAFEIYNHHIQTY